VGLQCRTDRAVEVRGSLRLDIDHRASQCAGDSRHALHRSDDELAQVIDTLSTAANDDVIRTGDLECFDHAGYRARRVDDSFARADFGLNQDVRLDRHGEPFISSSSILPFFMSFR